MAVPSERVLCCDARTQRWLDFRAPVQTLTARCHREVLELLAAVQQAVASGYYAAGFLSYEAAPSFDASLVTAPPDAFPLAWFGLFHQPEAIALPIPSFATPLAWQPTLSPEGYREAIAQIKDYIARGETYQVNFSYRLQAAFSGDPWDYFCQLIAAQACQYGAFVQLPDWTICSASPELFFRWQGQILTCCPMKGTVQRGLTGESDRHLARTLQTSPKEQAENLMIVDMIRNDLGRLARVGSVQVQQLFALERYPTVWQLTSPVTCTTEADFPAIIAALFPCASITGAPKARTMAIIAELETLPRRIYTGSIGFLTPDAYAQFNVAIRTVLIDRQQQQAEYGVGGGIVWDSQPEGEWAECAAKARVLTQCRPAFDLLETLLWQPESGYFLLDFHLQRLQDSADYFAYPLEVAAVQTQLAELSNKFQNRPYKVRLLVDRHGAIAATAERLEREGRSQPWRLGLAPEPVDSNNVFLYHKTTQRNIYDRARRARPDCDDTLLWNQRGELTETCRANLILELEGTWYTPPVACGLLAGTYRAWLLQQGKLQERPLALDDLARSSRLWIANSVRQLQPAIVVDDLAAFLQRRERPPR